MLITILTIVAIALMVAYVVRLTYITIRVMLFMHKYEKQAKHFKYVMQSGNYDITITLKDDTIKHLKAGLYKLNISTHATNPPAIL